MARYRWLALCLLVLAGFAALELWPNDEARIVGHLRELAVTLPRAGDSAGQAELASWFAAHAAPDLVVRVPDSGVDLDGPAAVSRAVHDALAGSAHVQITLGDSTVHAEHSAARATTICTLISRGLTELKDMRRVSTTWSKRAGDFQLDLVEIGPPWHDQPEARP
ncbi:MAG TPA: hypothetical protein VGM29_14080 [Polyangiaceae bacterium]